MSALKALTLQLMRKYGMSEKEARKEAQAVTSWQRVKL